MGLVGELVKVKGYKGLAAASANYEPSREFIIS
jgi:hypothetical protein